MTYLIVRDIIVFFQNPFFELERVYPDV